MPGGEVDAEQGSACGQRGEGEAEDARERGERQGENGGGVRQRDEGVGAEKLRTCVGRRRSCRNAGGAEQAGESDGDTLKRGHGRTGDLRPGTLEGAVAARSLSGMRESRSVEKATRSAE